MSATAASVRTILAKGVGAVFALKIAGALVVIGTQVLLARLLGVGDYGAYAYALAWLQVLLVLGMVGLDTLTVRYTAEYGATGDWQGLRGLLTTPTRWVVAASSIVALLAALFVWSLKSVLPPEQPPVLWAACIALPLVTLATVKLAALRGFKQILRAESSDTVMRNTLLVAVVVGIYLSTGMVTAAQTMVAYVAVSAVILAIAIVWVRAAVPVAAKGAQASATDAPIWVRTALPLWGMALMGILLNRLDILMLGAMVGTEASGIYTAVTRLAELTAFGLMAVNAFIAPRVAELFRAGKHAELQQLITWSARGIAVVTLLGASTFALFGEFALGLFGSDFRHGYGALMLLLLGQLVNGLCGSVGLILTMTGHERRAAWIMCWSAVLNAVLNAVLIPMWGMVGAAAATAVTLVIWNVWMLVVVVRTLRLNPTCFFVPTPTYSRNQVG